GIVHRDLKPANILLSKSAGRSPWSVTGDCGPRTADHGLLPKITDFGLAKLLQADPAGPTQTGDILGTPSYMSPEQVETAGRAISPATDVYGLGAVLYELLTGRPPFRGETPLATCRQILSTDPVPPSRLQPACPRDAETICLKCLQKEPHKRYASALALAEDLERFLEGRPTTARPISAWERAMKWARRRPAIATLAAGIVAVTLLGLASTTWQWRVAESRRAEADLRRAEAQTRSYCDRIARANQEWSAHNVSRANQLLDECYHETPELCRWEWSFLKRRCNEHLVALQGHTLDVRCIAYSPDGRLLASCSGEWNGRQAGEVFVWDVAKGVRLHSFSGHRSAVYGVAFHPDGRHLASASPGEDVLLWDLDHCEAKPAVLNRDQRAFCVTFSPCGKWLAAGCGDGHVRVTELVTRQPLHDWFLYKDPILNNIFSIAYSPDGRHLATAGRDGWVYLIDANTGSVVRRFPHGGDARRVVFSPDGRWLASGAFEGTVKLLDLSRNESEPVLYHLRGGIFLDLAFSPDGLRLACSTRMGGVVLLFPETGQAEAYLPEDLGVLSLAFRPDGERLATAGENLLVKEWDLTRPREPISFIGHTGYIYSLAISPDQRPDQQHLALAGAYNTGYDRPAATLRLFHLAKGEFLHEFAGHTDSLTNVAFRPDGQQLATASGDQTVRLWNVLTKNEECRMKHGGAVTGVAYSPDGNNLASSCADGQLRLWSVADGQLLRTFSGHEGGVNSVGYAPNGKFLVSAGVDRTVQVWDIATGRAVGEYRKHDGSVSTVVFNADGSRLASADVGQTVRLWQVGEHGELHATEPPIQLGLPAAVRELAVLGGSRRGTTSLAFSPDGQRLASASPDRPVQLWDAATGREVLALADTPNKPLCVAFSPDGRRLVLSADGMYVAVWEADFPSPEQRAQAAAARAFDWHWRLAKQADNDKAPFVGIFHATQSIRLRPEDDESYHYRGWWHAELGHWSEARADYVKTMERHPEDSWLWYRHAITFLGAGELAGYHGACVEMLRRFADKPEAALDCLYACTPDPQATAYADQLLKLGRAAVATQKALLEKAAASKSAAGQDARRSYGVALRAHGAALYRAGRFAQAVTALEEAATCFAPRAWDWLLLAMAYQQLQEEAKARNAFDKAVQAIAGAGQARTKGSTWFSWHEQVEVEALQREAESLLGGKP
ncbi:MAG TPA: protein kinase, partial [Gemmataceae bacterium]|nr:protein kinase [Gemmataceae bacterium]